MTVHPSTPDGQSFDDWIGREEHRTDGMALSQAAAVAAMLDRPDVDLREGATLPALWHWFYFLPRAPQQSLGEDGHPERSDQHGFLPPVPLPRRMFAGSRVTMHAPLRLGIAADRRGEIVSISHKTGRSGSLAFVTVSYTITQNDVLCLTEEQDIVYREQGAPIPPYDVRDFAPVQEGTSTRVLVPDSRLLFRFSALTFNAHRIHYDRPYATNDEGYPGLVVHGPLSAVLLADLVEHTVGSRITSFVFKGVKPLFDGAPMRLVATPLDGSYVLRAEACDGGTAIEASATVTDRVSA